MVAERNMTPVKKVPITILVPVRFHEALCQGAKEEGYSLPFFSETLLNAAWAARFQKSGDPTLDNVVRGTLILWSNSLNIPAIAETLNIQEGTVQKIIDAYRSDRWREELRSQGKQPVCQQNEESRQENRPASQKNVEDCPTHPLADATPYEKILFLIGVKPGTKVDILLNALFHHEKMKNSDLSQMINVPSCDANISLVRKKLVPWQVAIVCRDRHYWIPAEDKQKLIDAVLKQEVSS